MARYQALLVALALAASALAFLPGEASAVVCVGSAQLDDESVDVSFASSSGATVTLSGHLNVSSMGLSAMFQQCNLSLFAECENDEVDVSIDPELVMFDPETNPLAPPYQVPFTVTADIDRDAEATDPAAVRVWATATASPGVVPWPISEDTCELMIPVEHGFVMEAENGPAVAQGDSGKLEVEVVATGNTEEVLALALDLGRDMADEGISAKTPDSVTVPFGGSAAVDVAVEVGGDAATGFYEMELVATAEDGTSQSVTLELEVVRGDGGGGDDDGAEGEGEEGEGEGGPEGGGNATDGDDNSTSGEGGDGGSSLRSNILLAGIVITIAAMAVILVLVVRRAGRHAKKSAKTKLK